MDDPVVSTLAGVFRGSILTSFCDLPIAAYRGIPYARPPVGRLRFSRPEALPPMQVEYDATQEGPISLQPIGVGMKTWKQQEDCLYLNVFTPTKYIKEEKLLKKVMVFIHGGGYFMGCANQHVPGDLVAQGNVIVVTFNYRLSWLGFVKGPTEEVKGNMGLWDQLEALKWVNRNIRSFGGDPDDVTLAGQSMGGESVSALSGMKQAKHLFSKGILMSGSIFSNKSTVDSSDELLNQLIDKTHLNREGKTCSELVEELRNLPEQKFVSIVQRILWITERANHSNKQSTYFLLFDHWPSYCPDRADTAGMVHGLDLCYLFDIVPDEIYRTYNGQITPKGFAEEDQHLKRLFINTVVDFMHHGNANSSMTPHLGKNWPPFEPADEFYLKFGPKPVVERFPFKERRNLWKNIVPIWEKEEHASSFQIHDVC